MKKIIFIFIFIFLSIGSDRFCQIEKAANVVDENNVSTVKDSTERKIFQVTFGSYLRNYLPIVKLSFISLDINKRTSAGLILTPYNKELGKYGILNIAFGLQYQFLEWNEFGISTIFSIGDFIVYRFPPLASFNIAPGITFHQEIFKNTFIVSSIEYEHNFDNSSLKDFRISIGLRFSNTGSLIN